MPPQAPAAPRTLTSSPSPHRTSSAPVQSVSLAGEFNELRKVTDEQWEMLESMIRKTNKKGS